MLTKKEYINLRNSDTLIFPVCKEVLSSNPVLNSKYDLCYLSGQKGRHSIPDLLVLLSARPLPYLLVPPITG